MLTLHNIILLHHGDSRFSSSSCYTPQPSEKKHRVVEDSDAVLECRTSGAPKPKIKWSRGAQVLSGSRYHILDYGDLKILNVEHNDQVGAISGIAVFVLSRTKLPLTKQM